MNEAMMLYGGLDLHGNNVYCALVDCARQVVYEKRLPNELEVTGRWGLGRWGHGALGSRLHISRNWID